MNHAPDPLRVLFVGMRYDYGDPRRGECYEYRHFYHTLTQMGGVQAAHFPYDTVLREHGRKEMNRKLLAMVDEDRPDLCLFVLFTDEFDEQTISRISSSGVTRTVNWFADDHWRFESFSRHWAPHFNFVTTTDHASVERYRAAGVNNVIQTQWAFDHFRPGHPAIQHDYAVTFVGQAHSHRHSMVQHLLDAGIDVRAWGRGWPGGRLPSHELESVYVRSRINLNFVESSIVRNPRTFIKVLLNRRADDTLQFRSPRAVLQHVRLLVHPPHPQIKGRTFEVPGVGGFLLTGMVDDLGSYLEPGKEVAVFTDNDDLVEKVRYYLAHDAEREAVRQAGHTRVLREHTYEQRFRHIFQQMGFHANL